MTKIRKTKNNMERSLLTFTWSDQFDNATFLITGGTGSLGIALTFTLLRKCSTVRLIIFSRDEFKQANMKKALIQYEDRVKFMLGDVRDVERLKLAMRGVDYVVHTAALKHVDAIEYNPEEAVKTIVMGGLNVIQAADFCHVKKVVALSTDKACTPVNLYGAAKLCSDKLFVAANSSSSAKFCVVRYGNVFTSRGSVVPFFVELLDKGGNFLPVTDVSMTRFSISLETACNIVFNAMCWTQGGELFIPRISSYRVLDLVSAFSVEYQVTGIRPGEKLHEEMVAAADSRNVLEFSDHYVLCPNFPWFKSRQSLETIGGKPVSEGFTYRSDVNSLLSIEAIRELLDEYKMKTRIDNLYFY